MAGDVHFNATADTSQATQQMEKLNNTFKKVGDSVQKSNKSLYEASHTIQEFGQNIYSIGTRMTLGISAPLGAMVKTIVEGGASMTAFESAYKQSMKSMASKADEFASQTAQAVGSTTNQIRQQIFEFNKYAKGMGMSGEEALSFAEKMTKLTDDLSAFSDVPMEEATDRMKSALMGNFEAVDALGLSFGEATIKQEMLREGLKGQYSELQETKKMQLLYNLAVRQAGDAIGQAQRESNQYQAKLNKLKGTLQDLYKNVFVVIQPQILSTVDALSKFAQKLQNMTPAQINFIAGFVKWLIIAPPIIMYLGATIENLGRLGKVLSFTGKGLGKFFITLSKIGWIETLIIKGMYAWEAFTAVVTGTLSTIGAVLMSGLGAIGTFFTSIAGIIVLAVVAIGVAIYLIIKYWDEIKAYTIQVWNSIAPYVQSAWQAILGVFNQVAAWLTPIITAIATIFTDLFVKYVMPFYTAYIAPLVQMVVGLATAIFEAVKFISGIIAVYYMGVATLFTTVGAIIGAVIKFVVDVFRVLWQVFVWAANAIGAELAVLGAIFAVVFGVISTIVLTIGKVIEWLVVGIIAPIVAMICIYISWIIVWFADKLWGAIKWAIDCIVAYYKWWADIFIWLVNNIINPIINGIVSLFKWLNEQLKPIVQWLIDNWNSFAKAILAGYNSYIKPTFDFIVGKLQEFNSRWRNVWEGIKDMFLSVVNSIAGAWSKVINSFKLPHLTISGDFSITPPKVPSFGVKWYANGGIVDEPTLGVFGEAGTEANVPLGNLNKMKPFAKAVAMFMPDKSSNEGSGTGDVVIEVASLVVREEADINKIAEKLYKLQERNRRSKGVNK